MLLGLKMFYFGPTRCLSSAMTLTRLESVPSRAKAGCANNLSDAPDLKHFTFAIIQNESSKQVPFSAWGITSSEVLSYRLRCRLSLITDSLKAQGSNSSSKRFEIIHPSGAIQY